MSNHMKKNECIASKERNGDKCLNEVEVVHQLGTGAANHCCIQGLSNICEV